MLTHISKTYKDLGDNQKALDFDKEALSLFQSVGDGDDVATTLKTIDNIKKELRKQHTTF